MKLITLFTGFLISLAVFGQTATKVLDINPYTSLFLNENKDAFEVIYSRNGKEISSGWQKEKLVSWAYPMRNKVMSLYFFDIDNQLIDLINYENIVPSFSDEETRIYIDKENYFEITLTSKSLLVELNNIDHYGSKLWKSGFHVINLKDLSDTIWEKNYDLKVNDDYIYMRAINYNSWEKQFDTDSKVTVLDRETGETSIFTDTSLFSIFLEEDQLKWEYEACIYQLMKKPYEPNSDHNKEELTVIEMPDNEFFYKLKNDASFRKKTLGTQTIVYEDERNVIGIEKNNTITIYNPKVDQPFILTSVNYYGYGNLSADLKDKLLIISLKGIDENGRWINSSVIFIDIASKKRIFQTLPAQEGTSAEIEIPIANVKEYYSLNKQIIIKDSIWRVVKSSSNLIPFTDDDENNLKLLFGYDSIYSFNTLKRTSTKINSEIAKYVPKYSETDNAYIIYHGNQKSLITEHYNYYTRHTIPEDIIQLIPLSEYSAVALCKDLSWKLFNYAPEDYPVRGELRNSYYKMPTNVAGFQFRKSPYGEIDSYKQFDLLPKEESQYSINNHLAYMQAGVVPINDELIVIKSTYADEVMLEPKFDITSGAQIYDEYDNPMYEQYLNVGANNSGIFNHKKGTWLLPPSANDVLITKNGFIATYPMYETQYANYYSVGYDWNGKPLWEANDTSESERNNLAKRIFEMNEETIILNNEPYYISLNKEEKQSLYENNRFINVLKPIVTNADAIINIDPAIYLRNDSVWTMSPIKSNADELTFKETILSSSFDSNINIKRINDSMFSATEKQSNITQNLQLSVDYGVLNAVIYKHGDLLTYDCNPQLEPYFDDDTGMQLYDDFGNPMYVEFKNHSTILQHNKGKYTILRQGLTPVIGKSLFAIIPSKYQGNNGYNFKYEFFDSMNQPILELNKEDIYQVSYDEFYDSYTALTRPSGMNNAILIDKNGKIIHRGYASFYYDKSEKLIGEKENEYGDRTSEELDY